MDYRIRVVDDTCAEAWNALVAWHPLARGLVSSAARAYWRANFGWSLHLLALLDQGELCGGLALLTKPIPLSPFCLARVPVLMPDLRDPLGSGVRLLEAAERAARAHRALELEARCQVTARHGADADDPASLVQRALDRAGYRPTATRHGTYVIDLEHDDDALLAAFHPTARRKVRRAQRAGVAVQRVSSAEGLRAFCDAHRAMCVRKRLPLKPQALYDGLSPLHARGDLQLFVASHRDRSLNFLLIEARGVPRFMMGATTGSGLEPGVPSTGQPLHFHAMRALREAGARCYDLSGAPAPDPAPPPAHPRHGVWRFKRELGGDFCYWLAHHRRSLSRIGRALLDVARRGGRLR